MKITGLLLIVLLVLLIATVMGALSFGFVSLVLATWPMWFKVTASVVLFLSVILRATNH